jgi:hypothetical protein
MPALRIRRSPMDIKPLIKEILEELREAEIFSNDPESTQVGDIVPYFNSIHSSLEFSISGLEKILEHS